MINVDDKPLTKRTAIAEGYVRMNPETLDAIVGGNIKKGDVLCVSKISGISGAKQTPALIPMCHPVPLGNVEVDAVPDGTDRIRVTAKVITTWKTGVEMEALTAVSVACLNVYDMCKYMDRGMRIEDVRLLYKSGGKSGEFVAE